jgi:hypothetical protein
MKRVTAALLIVVALGGETLARTPCYQSPRPIRTTHNYYYVEKDNHETEKVLAAAFIITIGVLMIHTALQPSQYNQGQVRLGQF